jgi:hypothetical protein
MMLTTVFARTIVGPRRRTALNAARQNGRAELIPNSLIGGMLTMCAALQRISTAVPPRMAR